MSAGSWARRQRGKPAVVASEYTGAARHARQVWVCVGLEQAAARGLAGLLPTELGEGLGEVGVGVDHAGGALRNMHSTSQ